MRKIALVYGNGRYKNIVKALNLLREEIIERIKNKNKIVIKPNFVRTSVPLAATNVMAVKGILDFLKQFNLSEITIAEGAFEGPTDRGYKEYGYYQILKNYPVKFVDLNNDDYQEIEIKDSLTPQYFTTLKLKISKTILESDFRISVGPPKTHESVGATLTLKNLVVGSIITQQREKDGNYWRGEIHQYGKRALGRILFYLAKIISPDLSVLDAFEGMEGDGPSFGEPVKMNLAIVGFDFVAVDSLGVYLMGFNPQKINYLRLCAENQLGEQDFSQLKIVGLRGDLEKYRQNFRPNPQYPFSLKD